MIPRAQITHWSTGAPWPSELQVEQDLILSRLIVEIANHELLGPRLAFRGGTCLHKLHLPTAQRYSEDLDYVRTGHGPVGPIVDAVRELTAGLGLQERSRKLRAEMVTYVCRAEAESGGTIRIKIEIIVDEVAPFLGHVRLPYAMTNPWFEGGCDVMSFTLEELLATKLRALYQRRKGRDLFDLWRALTTLDVDDAVIVSALDHYMRDEAFSYPQLAANLGGKLRDRDFASDISALTTTPPSDYALDGAADHVLVRLGARLRNAPPVGEIAGGRWRS